MTWESNTLTINRNLDLFLIVSRILLEVTIITLLNLLPEVVYTQHQAVLLMVK